MTCSSNVVLINSVIWGDSALQANPEIFNDYPLILTYSDVQGGYAGTGNINVAPLFLNASLPAGEDGVFLTDDDGLTLQSGSPCKDTGTSGTGLEEDILGNPRPSPVGGLRDMGAFELQQ